MNAMKNAAHFVILALWVVLGILFSLKTLFLPALLPIALFWAWFVGYATFTTWLSGVFKSPLGALATHALLFCGLHFLPKAMPFSVFRLGIDLAF